MIGEVAVYLLGLAAKLSLVIIAFSLVKMTMESE